MYQSGYDHIKSPTVDVVKHVVGEFVQVWDEPFKTPGRKLLLTYFRDGKDVSDVTVHEYPSDGDFSQIVKGENYIRSYYRDKEREPRIEATLPNGKVTISDESKGIYLKSEFTPGFDFEKLKPKGRALGDRAVIKKHKEQGQFYVSTYQQFGESDPELVMVKEYLGKNVVETWYYEFTQSN